MRITVAICTWNRCGLLRQTLEELTRVIVPESTVLEVLVVNNKCSDATDAVIDEFRARLPICRVFEARPGLSHARNAALAASAAEYIIFTDDDVLVDESWLVALTKAVCAFPEATVIGGAIAPWFPQRPDPDILEAFPVLKRGFCGLNYDYAPGVLPDETYVWGANMAYRRAGIEDLRFDPNFGRSPTSAVGAEEIDFIRRVRAGGGSVVWWPDMRVRHYVIPSRMTLEYLLMYTVGKGCETVLVEPVQSARLLGGAPRWLWRQYAEAFLNCLLSFVGVADVVPYPVALSGSLEGTASARVMILRWRREVQFLRGMIIGHRQLTRRRRQLDREARSRWTESADESLNHVVRGVPRQERSAQGCEQSTSGNRSKSFS